MNVLIPLVLCVLILEFSVRIGRAFLNTVDPKSDKQKTKRTERKDTNIASYATGFSQIFRIFKSKSVSSYE